MKDHMIRVLTEDGSLRACAAVTTGLVREICDLQQTDPLASVALGRLVTGTALLGSLLKGRQRLALSVEGNGPLRALHAETDAFGHLCGSIKVPDSGLAVDGGILSVADAVGRAGFLHVIKDLGLKEPYQGMVQLQTSEIAEDLAYYLTTSEQVPSSVALGVYLETDGSVAAAGGFLVQAMPACPEENLQQIEATLSALPPVSELIRQGQGPEELLQRIFAGIPFSAREETPLVMQCRCNRERVLQMLRGLSVDELSRLIEQEEETTVTCEFCKQSYVFSRNDLVKLRSSDTD